MIQAQNPNIEYARTLKKPIYLLISEFKELVASLSVMNKMENEVPDSLQERISEYIKVFKKLKDELKKLEDPNLPIPLGENTDHVPTPDYIKEKIKLGFGEYYDPCPLKSVKDHLKHKWKPFNYVNPPYSNIEPWFKKAIREFKKRGNKTIMLIPFFPEAADYWKLWNTFSCQILVVRDPYIRFPGFKHCLPYKMVFVFFGFKWSDIRKGLQKQTDHSKAIEKVTYFGKEHQLVMFCDHLCERVMSWPI